MISKKELKEVVSSPYFMRHVFFFIALSLYIFWIFYRPENTKHSEAITGLINVRATHIEPISWWWLAYIAVFHLIYTYVCFGKGGYKAMWNDTGFPITYFSVSIFVFGIFFMSYTFSYSKLRSITKTLEYSEKGIITDKKYVYKELSGGGRGGKSSYSSHDVHYQSVTNPEIKGTIHTSKKKYDLYQEGDTIFLEHYTSWVDDYTTTYYYPSKSK